LVGSSILPPGTIEKADLLPPIVAPSALADEKSPGIPCPRRGTHQRLRKIPGIPGLYRHENGSYYGKKKIDGTRRVAALTTADDKNIFDRKQAVAALNLWTTKLETPTLLAGKKPLAEWFSKLKELWGGKAPATVHKVDYAKRCFELDYEAQNPKGPNLLTTPLDAILPSELSAFLSRLSKKLGAHAFNGTSRIIRNAFEVAVNDGAILANPFSKIPKTIRRKKIIPAPAKVPTIEQCQAICADVRGQKNSPNPGPTADMLEFMHKAALGQAECILADWEKVNWTGGYIEVRRQKTGAYFRVPLYEHLKAFLVAMWERQGKPEGGPLFSILSPKQALYNACRRLDYETYSPIDFRKARITWLLRKGIPVELIAKWQGHKDNGVLIRKTYSWVISEADNDYEKAQLAKLSAPVTGEPKSKGKKKAAAVERAPRLLAAA